MTVEFAPEIEEKLSRSAAQRGCDPRQFAQEIVSQYLDDEARFVAAVRIGEEELKNGNYLTHEEVGQRLARFLHR